MVGRVVSIKMEKTVTVLVTRTAVHSLYKKTYMRSKKYLAADDLGVKLGDIVEIEKIRPLSKNKHWKVTKVIGRSMEELVSEHLQEKGEEIISEVMPEEKSDDQLISESVDQKETKKPKRKRKEKTS